MEFSHNPDRLNIEKIPAALDEFTAGKLTDEKRPEYITQGKRIYASLRREGATPDEAFELLFSGDESAWNHRGEIIRQLEALDQKQAETRETNNNNAKRRKLVEKYQYPETLRDPEAYLYHGSSSAILKSFKERGLMAKPDQRPELNSEICFWVGNQELHQVASDHLFCGFGFGGLKLRVKASTLADFGFIITPIDESGKSVRAEKENPVIPPEYLEVWDPDTRLWLPLSELDTD